MFKIQMICRRIRIFCALCLLTLVGLGTTACAEERQQHFIVVAPKQFADSLREFIAYKQKQFSTELVVLEEVLAANEGVDDAEKLKRFLYQRWQQKQCGYVLLVGDADVLPVRYMVLDRVTEPAFHYAFYPSDLYYSDLAKADGSFENWNGSSDDFHGVYFGEVRGEANKNDPINFDKIDYIPDVAIGRWPVSTPDEVRLLVSKSFSYEARLESSDRDQLRKMALFSVDGWIDSRPALDRAAASLGESWKKERRYYGRWNGIQTAPPTESEIKKLLNQGMSLVMHAGHGQDDRWEECFPVSALPEIQNADRLPVILSAGCSTARFATLPPYEAYVDASGTEHVGTNLGEVFKAPPPPPACYQQGKYNPTGLGEQLLRGGPNGAIAYIGCNTGSQPCGLTLLMGFANAYAEQKNPRLGDCWAGAVAFYHKEQRLSELVPNDDWYPPSIFFQGMKFMCFGDPTLPLP